MTIRTMNAITVKEIPVVRELNVDLGNLELKGCGFNENDELILKTLHPLLKSNLIALSLQLIAYETAKIKGCNIDKPKNLAKSVTVE